MSRRPALLSAQSKSRRSNSFCRSRRLDASGFRYQTLHSTRAARHVCRSLSVKQTRQCLPGILVTSHCGRISRSKSRFTVEADFPRRRAKFGRVFVLWFELVPSVGKSLTGASVAGNVYEVKSTQISRNRRPIKTSLHATPPHWAVGLFCGNFEAPRAARRFDCDSHRRDVGYSLDDILEVEKRYRIVRGPKTDAAE